MAEEIHMQAPRKPLIPKRDETAAMRAATPDLNRLGRYERRARSRLRRAMLSFREPQIPRRETRRKLRAARANPRLLCWRRLVSCASYTGNLA
jgi:hypothetical protein